MGESLQAGRVVAEASGGRGRGAHEQRSQLVGLEEVVCQRLQRHVGMHRLHARIGNRAQRLHRVRCAVGRRCREAVCGECRLPVAVVLIEQPQVCVGIALREPLDLVVGASDVLGRPLLSAGDGIDDTGRGVADERASVVEHHPFVLFRVDVSQSLVVEVEVPVRRMVVETSPVGTGVHPVPHRRPVHRGRAAAQPAGAFEDANRHPGTCQVAGDDGAVVAAADHHGVVSGVGQRTPRSLHMKAGEYRNRSRSRNCRSD